MLAPILVSTAVAFCIPPGETPPETPEDVSAATREEMSEWLMTYYQHPDPQTIPARIHRLSELKLLEDKPHPRAFEMFFGQIMRANPDKIAYWMSQVEDLPEAEQVVFRRAIWLSRTPQGKRWLTDHGDEELAKREDHPFFTGAAHVVKPHHLDMLWEWFFATGDKLPVLKIVGKYNLLLTDPGGERLPAKPPPGSDRATQLRYAIGSAAVWSSSSLATSHDKLYEILQEIQKRPRLPPRSRAWLDRVLQTVKDDRAAKEDRTAK